MSSMPLLSLSAVKTDAATIRVSSLVTFGAIHVRADESSSN